MLIRLVLGIGSAAHSVGRVLVFALGVHKPRRSRPAIECPLAGPNKRPWPSAASAQFSEFSDVGFGSMLGFPTAQARRVQAGVSLTAPPPLEIGMKTLAAFSTRTMARQCYASHKRNGGRVSSAASKPSSHASFALLRVRSSRADARFAVNRWPNLALVPKDAGFWVL